MSPKISVLIPVYNAESFLAAAVQCMLRQTVKDIEVIAIDDGSSDTSLNILRRLSERDPRLIVITQKNTGIVGALNHGLKVAAAKLIARMDADDLCDHNRLEKQLSFLSSEPACVAVGTFATIIDVDGDTLWRTQSFLTHEEIDAGFLGQLTGKSRLIHASSLMRREALMRVGGYRDCCQWAEDRDLYLRLAEIGKLANIPEYLYQIRVHYHNVTRLRQEQQRRAARLAIQDACARRGMSDISESAKLFAAGDAGKSSFHFHAASMAMQFGFGAAARKHAFAALRSAPLQLKTWKLLFRACNFAATSSPELRGS